MIVSDPQIAAMMLAAGFPPSPQVIAEGIGVVHAESGGNAENGKGGTNEHIGLWSLSAAYGSEKERLDPYRATVLAYSGGKSGGGYKQTKWAAWAPYEGGETEGTGPSRAPQYLKTAKSVTGKFNTQKRKEKTSKAGATQNVSWGIQDLLPGGVGLSFLETFGIHIPNPNGALTEIEKGQAEALGSGSNPLSGITGAIGGVSEAGQFLGLAAKFLFTPEGWLQLGQIVGGVVLIGWGLHHIITVSTGVNPTQTVTKTATKAAEVAAVVK
jgi:hypothetical protein